ncbi:MAG: tetratricopeptide repeat protein [Muribaculaceae bacterium]|nr:tetratricopeptide repeat protein [Muribaculaceae bacterium]
MEKKTPATEQIEQAEDIVAKARANKKTLVGVSVALVVVIAAVLVWLLVAQSGSRKADELIARADAAQNDSIALSLYADAAKAGYKSGNRAKAEMGIRLYREGKYEEALKYLDDASLDDEIAAAGVYTLQGDCHVNLDQLDQALKCYDKAISKADKNPEIVPFVLIKEANIYRAQEKYADEAKAYKTILDDYPTYVATTRVDIKKYYERALASQNQ